MNTNIFKGPKLINIHTNRLFWHAGAGKDSPSVFDRLKKEIKNLGKNADTVDNQIKQKVKKLWEKHLGKR